MAKEQMKRTFVSDTGANKFKFQAMKQEICMQPEVSMISISLVKVH